MPNSEDAEKSTGKTTLLAACAGRLSAVRQSQLDPYSDIQTAIPASQLRTFVHRFATDLLGRGNGENWDIPVTPNDLRQRRVSSEPDIANLIVPTATVRLLLRHARRNVAR